MYRIIVSHGSGSIEVCRVGAYIRGVVGPGFPKCNPMGPHAADCYLPLTSTPTSPDPLATALNRLYCDAVYLLQCEES